MVKAHHQVGQQSPLHMCFLGQGQKHHLEVLEMQNLTQIRHLLHLRSTDLLMWFSTPPYTDIIMWEFKTKVTLDSRSCPEDHKS